jgi:hypothetical protein
LLQNISFTYQRIKIRCYKKTVPMELSRAIGSATYCRDEL